MNDEAISLEIINQLNEALARELHVSIQYMLQHAVGSAVSGNKPPTKQNKFIADHSKMWLPGFSLKKIAITEMRHAEAIAERIVVLGGEPTTEPGPIIIGRNATEMLKNDRQQEREAIELYGHILDFAGKENDDITVNLFQRILSDEEKHYRIFSNLIG